MDFSIKFALYNKTQEDNFHLIREHGTDEYVFIHFLSPVLVKTKAGFVSLFRNSFILYEPHAFQEIKAQGEFENSFIHFYMNREDFLSNYLIELNQPYDLGIENIALEKSITQIIVDISFEKIADYQDNNINANRNMSKLFQLLSKEIASNRVNKLNEASKKQLFFKLRDAIYHKPDGWTIEKMASFVYYSRTHFSIRYKEFFGVSPKQELNRAKVDKAKQLLINSDYNVEYIAQLCNFNSTANFIRTFERFENISPGQYRNQHRFNYESDEELQ